MATVRMYWRRFLPAWVFPFIFLYGELAANEAGHPVVFFWAVAAPLFFWSFGRATLPWLRQEAHYWHIVFWAMVVPFLIWVFAVFSRIAVLAALRAANAA
jgi:hypothetical protein